MYLVSVGGGGVECVCVKEFLVLVLVLPGLDCLPQGVGALPAMLPGHTDGFQKKTGWRSRIDGYNLHSPPPTVAHQPRAGCISLVPDVGLL